MLWYESAPTIVSKRNNLVNFMSLKICKIKLYFLRVFNFYFALIHYYINI